MRYKGFLPPDFAFPGGSCRDSPTGTKLLYTHAGRFSLGWRRLAGLAGAVVAMSMNSDLDRYLRERRRSKGFYEPAKPFWQGWFAPSDKVAEEEKMVLDTIERDIRRGEEELEQVQAVEQKLEQQQEERVSLYQRFMRLFQHEQQVEEEIHEIKQEAAVNDTSVTDDFRALAQIQMRWLDRMPTRIKDEFKGSDDYQAYVEILQRRGVAKRR